MSRSDQYIGLTLEASEFLRASGAVLEETYQIDGAWGPISLGIWRKDINDDVNLFYRYTEEVQASPWSSGPMYFTHLKVELQKVSGGEPLDMEHIYSWHVAPDLYNMHMEYDVARGAYYV